METDTISGLSSLFELAAGLNIAFVAVEYSKRYTRTLSEKVFNFPSLISLSLVKCRKVLCEKETLNNLTPLSIEGESTFSLIEKCKRDIETLKDLFDTREQEMKENALELCDSTNFSSLSLWNFLFSVCTLFFIGFKSFLFYSSEMCFLFLSFITIIFQIIGWIMEWKRKTLDLYSRLGPTIILFLFSLLISIILSIEPIGLYNAVNDYVNIDVILPFLSVLPFLNFIVFFYLVKTHAKEIRKSILDVSQLEEKSNELSGRIKDLIAVNSVNNRLVVK